MRKDRLDELYDRFTPEERFNLTLEALARGDEQEAERLADGCPRRTYSMKDAAYQVRMRAGLQMTRSVCLALVPPLAKLELIDAIRAIRPHVGALRRKEIYGAYLDGFRHGSRLLWLVAGMEGDPSVQGDREHEGEPDTEAVEPAGESDFNDIRARAAATDAMVTELLNRTEQDLIAESTIVWTAFTRFCEGIGFAPETVLKAYFAPMQGRIERLKILATEPSTLDPNPEAVAECEEAMSRTWATLTQSVD